MHRLRDRLLHIMSQRRFVRYGLLALNVVLLGGVVAFILTSSPADASRHSAAVLSVGTDTPSDPLDQLSSADIAANLARMTDLAEKAAVINQADSVSAELAAPPVYTAVITKPQAVATDLKSRQDIQTYVVKAGETISAIATKFNVTSDSIRWSNNLTGDAVAAGTNLLIPPVNGIVYTVKAGDTPDTLATKYRASKDQIIAYNDAELSGLQVGERIIIPNGQIQAPSRSTFGGSGFAWGSSAIYGFNGYDFGFCTWYVANKRIQIGRSLPANLGNAATWDDRAIRAGLPVNKTPAYGAAVVTSQRGAGHVAFVERVNPDGSFWVSEMNSHGQRSMEDATPAGGWNRVDFKLLTPNSSYNFIH